MIRTFAAIAAALTLGAVALVTPRSAQAAHHEPVIQVVTVQVQPGKLDAYKAEVKKLAGALARLGSPATVRMWRTTAAGPNTGAVIVGVEYPNAEAWAADQPKLEADAEWQQSLARLPGLRTVLSMSLWKDISTTPAQGAGGKTLVITGVEVKPGKLEEYRKRVGSARAISDRLGLESTTRMWHAQLAGPDTGNVAVGIEYADLATYVAENAKLTADPEWQKLLAGLDELRTIRGRWLYEAIPF